MELLDDCIEVELHKAVNAIKKSIYLLEETVSDQDAVEKPADESEGYCE